MYINCFFFGTFIHWQIYVSLIFCSILLFARYGLWDFWRCFFAYFICIKITYRQIKTKISRWRCHLFYFIRKKIYIFRVVSHSKNKCSFLTNSWNSYRNGRFIYSVTRQAFFERVFYLFFFFCICSNKIGFPNMWAPRVTFVLLFYTNVVFF